MVYRGKPSEACESCRARRIKCDKKRPGCTQCSNISIQCPGYRDLLALAFHDETDNIARKVSKRQQARQKDGRKGSTEHEPLGSASPSLAVTAPSQKKPPVMQVDIIQMPPSLQYPAATMALNHFLSTYVRGSHFEYVPDLYLLANEDSTLRSCIKAAATAAFALDVHSAQLASEARHQYGRAMLAVNASLRKSNEEALSDHTLVSVLLLSLFETIFHEGDRSTDSLSVHTKGALTLMRMRGAQQFWTKLGRLLYTQVASNIRISALARVEDVPKELTDLDLIALQFEENRQNPVVRIFPICDGFTYLRRAAKDPDNHSPESIIDYALRIDQMAVDLANSLPPEYSCEDKPSSHFKASAFGKTAFVHANHRAARLWNTIRMSRIFMNEVIHVQALRLMEERGYSRSSAAEYWQRMAEESAKIACDNACDVAASLPQFIDEISSARPGSKPAAAIANSLLWAIAVAGAMHLAMPDLRRYFIDASRVLGEKARLSKAARLADMLEERGEWDNPSVEPISTSFSATQTEKVGESEMTSIGCSCTSYHAANPLGATNPTAPVESYSDEATEC